MRFWRKLLEKQTHIDHFSLKKNPKRIYLYNLFIIKHKKFHPFPASC